MRTMRHFLTLGDLHPHELETLFSTATHLKRPPPGFRHYSLLSVGTW